MAISFQLPTDVEERLRSRLADLDETAKEAMAIEFYRRGELTHHELSRILGLSRYETDGVLKKHNVIEDLPTAEELRAELDD